MPTIRRLRKSKGRTEATPVPRSRSRAAGTSFKCKRGREDRLPDFDAVADPSHSITADMSWDGCHLLPAGYQIVADSATQAVRGL